MDRKSLLEKAAIAYGIGIAIGAAWFWTLQVQDVLELLSLAG